MERGSDLTEEFLGSLGVHQQGADDIIERGRTITEILSQAGQEDTGMRPTWYSCIRGGARKLGECLLNFRHRRNLDASCFAIRIASLFADSPNVRPEGLGKANETAIRLHPPSFSRCRTNSSSDWPRALQTKRSSSTSSRRSPDSYLLTNDCGISSRIANCAWVRFALRRNSRSRRRSFSCSSEWMCFNPCEARPGPG